jgi:hypothetical protein
MRLFLDQTTGGCPTSPFKPLDTFHQTYGESWLEEKQIHRLFEYPNTNPKLTESQSIQQQKKELDVGSTVYVCITSWCKLHTRGRTSKVKQGSFYVSKQWSMVARTSTDISSCRETSGRALPFCQPKVQKWTSSSTVRLVAPAIMGIHFLAIDKSNVVEGKGIIARLWTKSHPFFRDSLKLPYIAMLQV